MAKKNKKNLGKKIVAWILLVAMILSVFTMAITILVS